MDLKSFREDKLKIKTQSAFAELINVDQSNVSRWEKDPNTIPFQVIQRILEKTGASYEELTGWKKPIPEPLKVKNTWKKVIATKCTLSEDITGVLQESSIPDEYKNSFVEELRNGILSNLVKPKVAIVGRSDTGKSTLINALLGIDKMPASWTPTTSIAVYIKHISDKPEFIEEDVWVFANQVKNEILWDVSKLNDEEYCRSWKIAAGGVEILSSFGTRQGENYDKEAGSAVVFIDAPILKTCDIVDLPGFGTETESDDNITFAAAQKADVVLYLSQANGFMRIEDITYLKCNIKELPIWEKKDKNSLKPLSNLFVIASQAHTVNNGNRAQLEEILDVGCKNLLETLPNEYWDNRKEISGYDYVDYGYKELRSRFFAYTVDIPDLCIPFNKALTDILESMPLIIDERARNFVKSYIELKKPDLINQLQKYEGILKDREKYVCLLNDIEKNELTRIQENDNQKKLIKDVISRLSSESVNEFSAYFAEIINTDAIVNLMKEKGVRNRNEDIELFGSSLQSMIQERCEKILKTKSIILSDKTKKYVDSYAVNVAYPFEKNSINVGFDASWAFASALSDMGMICGFGDFLSTTFSGALLLAGSVYSMGTSVVGMLTATMLGPLSIAVGLTVAGSLKVAKLFGHDWETRVAKKFVSAFDEHDFSEKYKDVMRKYWSETEKTFDNAVRKLEEAWDSRVLNLQNAVNECDIDDIQFKIASLKYLSDFYERILL